MRATVRVGFGAISAAVTRGPSGCHAWVVQWVGRPNHSVEMTLISTGLSPLDVAFLCMERPATPMHMGVVSTFRPDRPMDPRRVATLVAERASTMPRLRTRARFSRWPGGAQWIDTPGFDAREHIVCRELPAGRTIEAHTSLWLGEPLDVTAPLWSAQVLTGLPGGKFAVLLKLHHAISDGLGAVEIGFGLLDPLGPPRLTPRSAEEPKSGARDAVRRIAESAGIAASIVRSTRRSPSPLHTANSPLRRAGFAHLATSDIRSVRAAHGGSTNDVVLAVLAGALREWLRNSGHADCDRPLQTLIPVSLRGRQPGAASGNRLSGYLCRLPVHLDDPVQRLHDVRVDMHRNKQAGPGRGAGALPVLANRLPSAAHRIATGPIAEAASTALFDAVITNVPVPGLPLALDGARLAEIYPFVPLASNHLIGVALSGYRDTVHLGLQANGAAVDDLGSFTDAITKSMAALTDATAPK